MQLERPAKSWSGARSRKRDRLIARVLALEVTKEKFWMHDWPS
jgi:hypothetical protein